MGVEAVGHRPREFRIVHVQIEFLEIDVRVEVVTEGAKQSLVGGWIVEDLAFRGDE